MATRSASGGFRNRGAKRFSEWRKRSGSTKRTKSKAKGKRGRARGSKR